MRFEYTSPARTFIMDAEFEKLLATLLEAGFLPKGSVKVDRMDATRQTIRVWFSGFDESGATLAAGSRYCGTMSQAADGHCVIEWEHTDITYVPDLGLLFDHGTVRDIHTSRPEAQDCEYDHDYVVEQLKAHGCTHVKPVGDEAKLVTLETWLLPPGPSGTAEATYEPLDDSERLGVIHTSDGGSVDVPKRRPGAQPDPEREPDLEYEAELLERHGVTLVLDHARGILPLEVWRGEPVPRRQRRSDRVITYTIDYMCPPGCVGFVTLPDGQTVELPFENPETGDFSRAYELEFLRRHGVTHVVDTEVDVGERDHRAPIPLEAWLAAAG